MKQARYATRGPVPQDVIETVECELPALGPGQVLVEVLAAPINPSDLLTLTGQYGLLPPLPAVGGNEGVGRVLALAEGVSAPAPGRTVLLPISGGTWSTHLIADARTLLPLPDDADPVQLSMITVNPPTARLLLSEFVDLQPGEWVIQNAANSAVGGYLVRLAALRGLKTVNVVRRESARDDVLALGADVVLVDGDDLGKRVREATGGAKIRLGVDAVGGLATERLAQSLCEGGVLVNYGAMSGEPCAVSPASLVFRDVALRGFWLARWFRAAPPERRVALFGELAGLIGQGKLRARVQATYGIDEIKQAVAAASAGERAGKIVLVPNGGG